MSRWGKPGVRIDADDRDRALRGYGRHIKRRQRQEARADWERGLVRPSAITLALDLRGLYGPEVDHACGVEEPTVDEWEAGETYPTWEQLVALAGLVDLPLTYFTHDWVAPIGWNTLAFHVPHYEPPQYVARFPKAVWQAVTA